MNCTESTVSYSLLEKKLEQAENVIYNMVKSGADCFSCCKHATDSTVCMTCDFNCDVCAQKDNCNCVSCHDCSNFEMGYIV